MSSAKVLVGTLLLAALAGCGSESTTDPDDDRPSAITVTINGKDSELVEFQAICPDLPADDPDAGYVHGYALPAGTDLDLTGSEPPAGPFAMVSILDEVPDGSTFKLPVSEEYGKEKSGLSVFVGERSQDVEASSSEEKSSGTIEIIRATCEPEPVLEVRLNGTLGSEFGDEDPVLIEGYARIS